MATIIQCPRTDCANNQAGKCDMALLDVKAVITIKNGAQAGVYLWCGAYEKKGAA